jgi:putative ABC transport system ATP-binding protein
VLDLDNTLWNCVLIEDGDVKLCDGLIDIIKELDNHGILQSITSKNEHEMTMTKIRCRGHLKCKQGSDRMRPVIEVENVRKSYIVGNVETEILKGINLTIEQGDFVSIMGPSGSGKSTLLYLIGGLDKPTSGTVRIMGTDLSKMNDKQESLMRRRDIGFVFQFYNLIPNLSVEENIMVPILLDGKKMKEYEGKLTEILEIVGLTHRRKHTPRELSGGQQQRVAIARALINDPEIILADEPIGNLDSKTGMEIMELLRDINRIKGKTIVQVTHSRESADYGTRLINVRDGEICIPTTTEVPELPLQA